PDVPQFSLVATAPAQFITSLPAPDYHDGRVHLDATQPLTLTFTGSPSSGQAWLGASVQYAYLPDGGADTSAFTYLECDADPATGTVTMPAALLQTQIGQTLELDLGSEV